MAVATRRRPNTSAPGDGSRTMTITSAPPQEEDGSGEVSDSGEGPSEVGTLRLRGELPPRSAGRRRVVWDADVVDNEGCGRKSSKICCIYHKPRNFDESSSESDSSDSGDDSSGEEYDARIAARRRLEQRQHERSHPHPHSDSDGAAEIDSTITQLEQPPPTTNAYEKAPPSSSRKGKARRKSGKCSFVALTFANLFQVD
ncbi:hypothetical protein MIND_00281500 [Mycena indigotica]|uniref:Type 1 phosphatases regulator n=1 Tax=Mycena indigotica TaxID=2126181 RepID=A0A8H6T9Z5_9AGAR|nr:uncharacterized protein MIND_00281500 [Mycena indigotica]KAF7312672.1 hypothetical protein MIND_00281500 [Mycena indigotica]